MLKGRIAQLVEQGIENPRVGGSTPSPATVALVLAVALPSGCRLLTDQCEDLCDAVADQVDECLPESISWIDLGATNKQNYIDTCRDQWDRVIIDLSANDLRLALDDCKEAKKEVPTLSCDEIVALYGP